MIFLIDELAFLLSDNIKDNEGGAYILITLVADHGPYSPVIPAVRTAHLTTAPSV